MATVATSTIADSLAPQTGPAFAYQIIDGLPLPAGYLYVLVRTATNDLTVYRSVDGGGSWASYAGFTAAATLQEWSSIYTDRVGYLHVAYRTHDGGADKIWYRRLNTLTGTWSSALNAANASTGTAGGQYGGVDIAVVYQGTRSASTWSVVIPIGYNTGSVQGIHITGVSVDANGAIYSNNGVITGNRFYTYASGSAGHMGVTCEIEHNGDGRTGTTPNIWITWGRFHLKMVKLAYQASWNSWIGPSGQGTTIRTPVPWADYMSGRWDGVRWIMAVASPDDATRVRVYQRNQANTSTTTLDTPTHPTGVVRYATTNHDRDTKNLRVFAVGTSSSVLYYVDYVRATGLWGTWVAAVATAVLGSGTEWSVRRGGTYGDGRHDLVTGAAGTPNTYTHTPLIPTSAPAISSFITSGQAYTQGGPANVAAALPLAWTFTDPDPSNSQGSYALSRQIGAGALSYWRASDSTWQATEQQNASATRGVTLASGWGADTDAAHSYRVKVWDNGGTAAPGYSSALQLVPSVPVNPTITAPTAGQVLPGATLTVAWTVAEQTAVRVVLAQTSPAAVTVYDSGKVTQDVTDLDFTVPYLMANGTGWTVTLYTYNNEGLASAAQTRSFTVAYAPPPAMQSTYAPSTPNGQIVVTPIALAPVGAQPAILLASLYRRPKLAANLAANPSMAGNVTGWSGGSATVTYSTTQFHDPPGSARVVPDGVGTNPRVQTTAGSAVTVPLSAGQSYTASGWIRPDTANKPAQIGLVFFDAANTELGTVTASMANIVAGAWHYLEVTGNAQAWPTAAKVGVRLGETSTPAAGDAFYADELQVRAANTEPGVRVVNGGDPTVPVADSGPAHGIDYEYRWVAQGANSTASTGPWTA